MKKLLALILSITLMFSLVACSSSSSSSSGSGDLGSESSNLEYSQTCDDATVEVMQGGDTVTVTLTGSIVTAANEKIENGEEMQLEIQFLSYDGDMYILLGSLDLQSDDEGSIYERCWSANDENYSEVYVSYDSEKIVFICPDCTIDFDSVVTVDTGIFIDGEYLYQQSLDMENLSFTEGEYEIEVGEGEYPFGEQNCVCRFYSQSDPDVIPEYISAEIEATYSGYILTCDYGTFTLTYEDDAHTRVNATWEGDTDIYATIDHENGEIELDIRDENGLSDYCLKFMALEALCQGCYTYDESGNTIEDALELSIDGTSIKICILGKYETDWLELSDEILSYQGELTISAEYGTNLETGEVCRITLSEKSYTYEDELAYKGFSYKIVNSGLLYIDDGVLINYYNPDYFAENADAVIGTYTDDVTGYNVEITNTQFIANCETSVTVDIDLEKVLLFKEFGSTYPVYIDGELAYTLYAYVYVNYEDDPVLAGKFVLYDEINEIDIIDYYESSFIKD